MVEDEPRIEHVAPPSAENNLTDRKAAKATDNAFEGAFGMMAQSEPEPSEASLSTSRELNHATRRGYSRRVYTTPRSRW